MLKDKIKYKEEVSKLKIDSHKLIYHVPRLYKWYKGGNVYPIYAEVGLYGGCNQRCIFCAFDFLKYKPSILNIDCAKKFISKAAGCGIRAILYSGEGEPLLHKQVAEIVAFTKEQGIDVALSTNGVMLDREKAERILVHLTWMRVSLGAGTEKGYTIVHRTKREDFNIVISNLKEAVKTKDRSKSNCTISVQFLLIPQNYNEAVPLVSILGDVGVDCLVIKPYSEHPLSKNRIASIFKQKDLTRLEEELRKRSKGNLQIVFRHHAIRKLEEDKPYKYCLGLPFATHVTAEGDVYPCNAFVGNKKFIFGNLYKENFNDIWGGQRRKTIMKVLVNKWDVKRCRKSCRLDEINRYLWELKNPSAHVNFI
jgi:radical SAM protein with 4Fe4S-binding SPASM domain